MIFFQTLWFMIKTAILIAAGGWLALRPGFINISFLDYDVRMQTGAGLLVAYVALLAVLFMHRLYLALADIPRAWRRYLERKRYQKGLQAVSLGLSAVAAGESGNKTSDAFKTTLQTQVEMYKDDDHGTPTKFDELLKDDYLTQDQVNKANKSFKLENGKVTEINKK